jgi:hypothetical protein
MRPGKGVENCLNAKDIVAGMAGRAQLDVTGSMLVNVLTKMRGIENQLRRLAGQLLLGSSAHPTPQDGSGSGNLTRELIAAVGDLRRLSFGFDDRPRQQRQQPSETNETRLNMMTIPRDGDFARGSTGIERTARFNRLRVVKDRKAARRRPRPAGRSDLSRGPPQSAGTVGHQQRVRVYG